MKKGNWKAKLLVFHTCITIRMKLLYGIVESRFRNQET